MRHRIFIAVSLPDNIKKALTDYQLKWTDLPCRWTRKDNLHITLVFLGYVADQDLPQVLDVVRDVISRHAPFSVRLSKIVYGPPKKLPPRMVWVGGEESEEMGKLQSDLEDVLSGQIIFEKEEQSFTPHITLGRIKEWEFRKLEPEERPEVNEDIAFNFEVNTIEVMESELKREGPDYTVLESIPLSEG